MDVNEAIGKVVDQFTKYNAVGINCVNKGAQTLESFKEDVYTWMESNIPEGFHNRCWKELYDAAWKYDILTDLINDDGSISDIACHSWDNVWIQVRGKWKELDYHFRDEDHFNHFFNHISSMNGVTMNANNASDNCTDITTFPNFRLRLNFIHKYINTYDSCVFSIRKIPTVKKTLEVLTRPEEGMLTPDMIPIIQKHLREATGILIVGMGGSGKTTFLNALIEELPESWKYLFIQENEELFSDTRRNADFLKTTKGINKYDISHQLPELARNGLLMSIKCFVIGETKGEEAADLFKVMSTGAVGITTGHSDSAEHGLETIANYIGAATGKPKDQCMNELTVLNKVFFLQRYRLREISTIRGYNYETHKLDLVTEKYDPNPWEDDGFN